MFDWLGDIFSGIGNAIGSTFEALGEQISNVIWNTMLQWLYETIYNAVADFFTMMGNMGADIFQLDWIQATIRLFTLFGWRCLPPVWSWRSSMSPSNTSADGPTSRQRPSIF